VILIAGGDPMAAPQLQKNALRKGSPSRNASNAEPTNSTFLRGNQSGSEIDDWLQAEEEIRRVQEQLTNES